MKSINKKTLFLATTTSLILLDQVTKYLATKITTPIELISNFAYFQHSQNTGIAWSIPVPEIVLLFGIPLIIILGSIFVPKYFNFSKHLTIVLFASLLAGAISNYVDRVRLGHVIDFIAIGSWPVFNLADVYISISAFLIIVFSGKIERSN